MLDQLESSVVFSFSGTFFYKKGKELYRQSKGIVPFVTTLLVRECGWFTSTVPAALMVSVVISEGPTV